MHTIVARPALGFIEVTITGLCSPDEFEGFVVALRAAIAAFPDRGGPPATLYNFTHASIQTQEVVARMRALAEHPAMVHRRVALYSEGVLARLQAKRISQNRANMSVFDNREAALAWLRQGGEAIAEPHRIIITAR